MQKNVLLIENDSAFAAGISESLEASGFEVRATGDGKEGLDLARDWSPEARPRGRSSGSLVVSQ